MEGKTVNKYDYPVEVTDQVRVTYDESPAHVDKLKYSVDFITKEGTPVRAALRGIVVDLKFDSQIGGESKELEPWGNFVEIRHPGDEYSEYEHLKKDGVLVKIGDRVEKGQIIGYSGSTGWVAHLGPHLHFMVGRYGDSVDDYETIEINWNGE